MSNRSPNPQHELSTQEIGNQSFDKDFNVSATEILGYDSSNNVLSRLLVDASGNLKTTTTALPSSVITGQVKVAVTGTAVQFPTNALTQGVIVFAKTGNAAVVTLGGSGVTNTVDGTGNGLILSAGAAVSYAGTNTNQLYLNGTAGDIVSFIGS